MRGETGGEVERERGGKLVRESEGGVRMENVVKVHCVKYEEDDHIKHMMKKHET